MRRAVSSPGVQPYHILLGTPARVLLRSLTSGISFTSRTVPRLAGPPCRSIPASDSRPRPRTSTLAAGRRPARLGKLHEQANPRSRSLSAPPLTRILTRRPDQWLIRGCALRSSPRGRARDVRASAPRHRPAKPRRRPAAPTLAKGSAASGTASISFGVESRQMRFSPPTLISSKQCRSNSGFAPACTAVPGKRQLLGLQLEAADLFLLAESSRREA